MEMSISESSKYIFLVLTVDGNLHFWWDQAAVMYQRVVAYSRVFVLACVFRSVEAVLRVKHDLVADTRLCEISVVYLFEGEMSQSSSRGACLGSAT